MNAQTYVIERPRRAPVLLGGIEHYLTVDELQMLATRVQVALASLVCIVCSGRLNARCFVCDSKEYAERGSSEE